MSSSSALEGRQRGTALEGSDRGSDVAGPGKQSRTGEAAAERSGGVASSAAASSAAASSGRSFRGAGGEAGAEDWGMSAGLSSALGLAGAGAGAAAESTVVRRKAVAAPAWAGAGQDVDVARAGFAGAPAASFPHRDAIERSFGAALPATAHTDAAAASASQALGAEGYALGNQVAFASPDPGLAVAAHEAAHVMQATSGVQLYGGEGAYEAHADAVADRVVRGQSAADLLAAGPAASPAVRRSPAPPAPAPKPAPATDADKLAKELQALIDGAVWKEIRKTVYPKESAGGVARAKERKDGKRADLTGLGKITALEHFAAAVKVVQKDWPKKSEKERIKALAVAVGEEMKRADVPEFLAVLPEVMESKGAFNHGDWAFLLSKEMVGKPALADAEAAELCNTALHEARHAEQAFLAARFAAGPPQNKDGAAIASEHGIPPKIATAAVALKFDAATDPKVAALGKQMHQASVTDGATNQQISNDDYTDEMKDKRKEAQVALDKLKAKADAGTIAAATTKRDELQAAIAEVKRRYTLYRNIPYEADAHEVGDAAEQAFKGWP